MRRVTSQSLAGQSSAKPAEKRGGGLRVALCALVALLASLALAGTAHAATAHLSIARGYKAASRYALRDVRWGDATGYRVYGCHYHGREVVCAADEYGVVSPDLGVGTWFGMRIVATARPHGWISVRENRNVITPPFRTR